MAQILLNGQPFEMIGNYSIAQLLERCELTGQRLAVEINQNIISRSQFESYFLLFCTSTFMRQLFFQIK